MTISTICERCGKRFDRKHNVRLAICVSCRRKDDGLLLKTIQGQLRRARKYHKPATLTLDEWKQAIDYFGGKCAYCQKREWEVIDHIVSIDERDCDRGTEQSNCVPCCNGCNTRKAVSLAYVSFASVKKYLRKLGVSFVRPRCREDALVNQPKMVERKYTREELMEAHHRIYP